MSLCVCEYCQNLFDSVNGQKICPDCVKLMNDTYARIKKYMYTTNERITVTRLVEKLGVPEKAVNYLIQENMLVIEDRRSEKGKCSVCGAPTNGERLCSRCRKIFSDSIEKYQSKNCKEKKREDPTKKHGVHPLINHREN